MSDHLNNLGIRKTCTAGKRVASVDKITRRRVAEQGSFQRAATLPATKQWRCSSCGMTNLERDVVCGGCGEERDMRTAEPKEVA